MRIWRAPIGLFGGRPFNGASSAPKTRTYLESDAKALLAPDRVLAFPYDLSELGVGASGVLAAQGYSEADRSTKSELCFFDSDMTLMASARTPVWLKHKESGERLLHPETNALVEFGLDPNVEVAVEYNRLRTAHPDLAWADYIPDGSAASDPKNILPSPPIDAGLSLYRAAHGSESSAAIVITGRGDQDAVVDAIQQWLSGHALDADAVLMMYHPEHQRGLGTTEAKGLPIRKSISMAGIIQSHLAAGAPLERIRFVEDSEDNLRTAAQILPSLFPDLRFDFVLVKERKGVFSARKIGARAV